jgi:nitrite reductase (NADH) large subunit
VNTHFVIIGNGAAGYRAAKALRRADADAQISIVTEERYPFYLRRQLGDFLTGALTLEELIFQSRNTYRRERIDLFLMTRIERIDAAEHEVLFTSGQRVRYDRLLIATGTHAVPLEIPGVDLEGVSTFDTLSQAQDVKALLGNVRRAAILGEGIVGLTLAESLIERGIGVTQFVRDERFWPEMLDEQASGLVEDLLEERGIVLKYGDEARAILGAGRRAIGVETVGGEALPAELVGIGCRRRPAIELVAGSGIEVGHGIRVDAALRTSQADVFAAGDVAEPAALDEFSGESSVFCWQRAWAQGGVAAAGMLGQKADPTLEAVRLRAVLFGHDLAVIGRGHLPTEGAITAVELREEPSIYRRLVFEDNALVGAIVFGTGESVHELNRMVAQHTPRENVEATLRLGPAVPGGPEVLPKTFARHCPICAAELVIHCGTRAGTVVRCEVCNTDLMVRWDGHRGWLDVGRP